MSVVRGYLLDMYSAACAMLCVWQLVAAVGLSVILICAGLGLSDSWCSVSIPTKEYKQCLVARQQLTLDQEVQEFSYHRPDLDLLHEVDTRCASPNHHSVFQQEQTKQKKQDARSWKSTRLTDSSLQIALSLGQWLKHP